MAEKKVKNQEYSKIISILENTKKEITKLQVNVQAFLDLKNLTYQEICKKIDRLIDNREKEEIWDEYICCVLSEMTEKSELNWTLYWQTKKGKDFLSFEETSLLSGIDGGRAMYLTEHINEQKTRDDVKALLKKLIKAYKA